MKKHILAILTAALACGAAMAASETEKLVSSRLGKTAAAETGRWLRNFDSAKAYAKENGLPLLAVWSNGDSCPHCVKFENCLNNTTFKNWMRESGMVFWFGYNKDAENTLETVPFHWTRAYTGTTKSTRGGPLKNYPFVRLWWPEGGSDYAADGDSVRGGYNEKTGATGAKKIIAWIEKRTVGFEPGGDDSVKPYTIKFLPNSGTGEMADVETTVGTTLTLPANTFTKEDWSFLGWAKTSSGDVAYANKASVRNLTTTSNGVVRLYAKWKRITYRTYCTGVKYTIAMTDLKGWATSSKVAGLTWNSKTGKWSGKPTKAGTFTVKFTKKGKSAITRKIVVAKDKVIFCGDDKTTSSPELDCDDVDFDLSPVSYAGDLKSINVSGLPKGISYSNGKLTGSSVPGQYTIKFSGKSANGQTVSGTFKLVLIEPVIDTFEWKLVAEEAGDNWWILRAANDGEAADLTVTIDGDSDTATVNGKIGIVEMPTDPVPPLPQESGADLVLSFSVEPEQGDNFTALKVFVALFTGDGSGTGMATGGEELQDDPGDAGDGQPAGGDGQPAGGDAEGGQA